MAVATAAATTMANNAEAARPRRKIAARTSMRTNIDVCGARSLRPARSCTECDMGALTVHLAEQKRDPVPRLAGSPLRCPEMSQSQQSRESLAAAREESK